MVPIQVTCDVDVDYVSFLQRSVVRYAVADDFIHRRAAAFGKIVIVQRRWVGAPLYASLVYNSINFISSNPWPNLPPRQIQHLPGTPSRRPHLLNLVRLLHLNHPRKQRRSVLWQSVLCVVRKLDTTIVVGNEAFRRLQARSDGSGVAKVGGSFRFDESGAAGQGRRRRRRRPPAKAFGIFSSRTSLLFLVHEQRRGREGGTGQPGGNIVISGRRQWSCDVRFRRCECCRYDDE
mmetsp:Transcript_25507/g.54191  ORF Transcript_25507/g.54191 Transcript_25507/m.54191 type:complete len:234 (+) Transcript_25507:204-905(+)